MWRKISSSISQEKGKKNYSFCYFLICLYALFICSQCRCHFFVADYRHITRRVMSSRRNGGIARASTQTIVRCVIYFNCGCSDETRIWLHHLSTTRSITLACVENAIKQVTISRWTNFGYEKMIISYLFDIYNKINILAYVWIRIFLFYYLWTSWTTYFVS